MTRASAIAVVAGALGGALLIAALRQSFLGVLLGAMLSPLPLAMTAFGLGGIFLPVAVVGGSVTVAILSGSFAFAIVYLVADAAPAAVLSRIAIAAAKADPNAPASGEALARTVCGLAAFAVMIVVVGLFLLPTGAEGIEAAVRARLDEVVTAMPVDPAASAELVKARAQFVEAMAAVLPGAVGWNWCLRALLSAALAQAMLSRMGLALWPTPAYREFEVQRWFILLFAGASFAALVLKGDARFVAGNAAAVLCLPLLLQGLAVAHSGAKAVKQGPTLLVLFYIVTLVTVPASFVLLIGLAVADHVLQLRARFAKPRVD
ncbi:MAG: DUF2232 domain-containing protein [Rhodospirillaceae bacterium]